MPARSVQEFRRGNQRTQRANAIRGKVWAGDQLSNDPTTVSCSIVVVPAARSGGLVCGLARPSSSRISHSRRPSSVSADPVHLLLAQRRHDDCPG